MAAAVGVVRGMVTPHTAMLRDGDMGDGVIRDGAIIGVGNIRAGARGTGRALTIRIMAMRWREEAAGMAITEVGIARSAWA